MSTVANEVRACVRRDPYLRETLARDVVSHAKLARWLREQEGVGGSEHAIISALRRMEVLDVPNPVDEGEEAIRHLDLELRDDMVAVTVEHSPTSRRRLESLREELGTKVSVLPAESTVTVVVPAEDHEVVLETLGRDIREDVREPLAMFTLREREGDDVDTPGALAAVTHHLAVEGVRLENVQMASGEIRFLVPEADQGRARRVIRSLMSDPR